MNWKMFFIISILCLLFGCSMVRPPLEFSPKVEIIKKALLFQLEQKHDYLSQNLQINPLQVKITQINVEQINPFLKDNLPIYHLQGTYNLNLQLKNKKVNQTNQRFDLYLQRQKEGKTWRLISENNRPLAPT